jgi:hypothetical protein
MQPRWCFRCVLQRAKDTLRLAKLDRSSHGATADGSSGFIPVAITKPTKGRLASCAKLSESVRRSQN